MADTQTDLSSPPSPAIADLAGSGSSAISDLVKVQKAKTAEDTKIVNDSDKRLASDDARVQKAFDAEGVSASEQLKPWDADKEHEKFESDPIAGFGSVGGLFAMVASAFTKAPMENAINGMAGAINSIKEGDEAGYQRAYDSYKQNVKLAQDRFKTQHELYSDAMGLMDHDQAAASVKLHNAAVRFGDQQTLMLLDHGMSKELFELQDARLKSMSDAQDLDAKTTEKTFRDRAFQAGVQDLPKTGNPAVDAAHKLALYSRVYGVQKETPQQALMGQFFLENPTATADQAAEFADKHGIIRQYGTAGTGANGKPPLTNDREINAEADSHRDQMAQEHGKDSADPWDADKLNADRAAYYRSLKQQTAPPTPNAVDKLRGQIDQTDNIIKESEQNIDFLKSYKGAAGVMGKLMRGEEIASNITGAGTESDRVQFRRRVEELQTQLPSILSGANGRQLASVQKLVGDVAAGLNAGDTGPNTIRAYEDLIEQVKKIQQDFRGRIEGGYDPGKASSGAGKTDQTPVSSDGSDPWAAFPEKQ